jgi:hypothetical protein
MKTSALALTALALVGCGAPPLEPDYWTAGGIGIEVETGAAEWAQTPGLGERVDAIARAVADYAGRPAADLGGVVVVVRASITVDCLGYGQRTGCAHWGNGNWIDLGSSAPWVTAVETTPLSHELLHEIIGDANHESELWRNLSDTIAPLVPDGCEFRPWTIDANAN